MTADEALARGVEALREWRWQEARGSFEASIAQRETPEALEGLASAALWLDDAAAVIASRERAFRLYREQHRSEAAARTAAQLAVDILNFRGDAAVASGWLGRDRDLVRDRPESPALTMITGIEAAVAARHRRNLPE